MKKYLLITATLIGLIILALSMFMPTREQVYQKVEIKPQIEQKSGDIWLCVVCIEEFGEWCPKREVKHWIDVYDFKFPHIVYAIFRLESGHGTSRIFLEQNNPFGFRQADRRLTTQLPSRLPFAEYASIEAAVIDFLLWERLFFHGETESEFLEFLDRIYCPSDYWIDRLIGVKRMNLWSN